MLKPDESVNPEGGHIRMPHQLPAPTACSSALHWWQRGVLYHIYPRSFQDSNGDGIGDVQGIITRLDYLNWLGVDALWLSPIFPSPMVDGGYDITDYCVLDPLFGDLATFEQLLDGCPELFGVGTSSEGARGRSGPRAPFDSSPSRGTSGPGCSCAAGS
jgi:hypothetical protein